MCEASVTVLVMTLEELFIEKKRSLREEMAVICVHEGISYRREAIFSYNVVMERGVSSGWKFQGSIFWLGIKQSFSISRTVQESKRLF